MKKVKMKWYNLVLKTRYFDKCFRYYIKMKVLASAEPVKHNAGVVLTGVTRAGMKRLEGMKDTRKENFFALVGGEEKSCVAGLKQLVWKRGRSEHRVFGWTTAISNNSERVVRANDADGCLVAKLLNALEARVAELERTARK